MQALTQRCCFDREAYRETPKFRVWPSSDLFLSCPSCSTGQQQFVTCVKISAEMFLIRNCQRNNLTRNDGSSPRKERTLQGIQRWGFSWWKRFFSPCTPMGWHHGQSMGEGKCGDQKLLFGKWKNKLQMEKASCVWAMESPVLHSQAQVAKDTGSATEDGEGRTRSLMANPSAAQLTPRAQRLLVKRREHTAATWGEHHITKFGIYMKMKASCWQGYRDNPKYPNQHTPGPNELLSWWYTGFGI